MVRQAGPGNGKGSGPGSNNAGGNGKGGGNGRRQRGQRGQGWQEVDMDQGTQGGGLRIGGRYEIGELLGRGGMAEVRQGTDLRLGRTVAIKRLRVDLATDPTFQARFRREAQSAAGLNHPNIVAVYDSGEEMAADGTHVQPYIVMEYVAGRTLRDVLNDGRKLLPERALEIMVGVLAALDYSHRAGIIHRDIKPANVMLTPAGDVKVMDFGIARAISEGTSSVTQTQAVVGTAQYLSPEQARGETVDSRSDVYSAGCLLYELLVGRPPFVGDSPFSVAYQHVREAPEPPSAHNPELPPELDAIVHEVARQAGRGPIPSAADMQADVQRYLDGEPVDVPTVVAAPVAPPPGRSRPRSSAPSARSRRRRTSEALADDRARPGAAGAAHRGRRGRPELLRLPGGRGGHGPAGHQHDAPRRRAPARERGAGDRRRSPGRTPTTSSPAG